MNESIEIRNRSGCSTYAWLGTIGFALVFFATMSATACTGTKALAEGTKSPEADISVVHWTIVRTGYRHGKKIIGPKAKAWMKYPDKRKIEGGDGGQIRNGNRYWIYNRKLNIYTYEETDPKKEGVYPKTQFTVSEQKTEWLLKGKSFGGTTEREMKAVFKDVEYPAVEMIVPREKPTEGKSLGAHKRVMLYEYPGTGLLRAKLIQSYGPDGKLQLEEEYEYEYDKCCTLSDDFFVFVPPPGAVKKDHW